MVLFRHYLVVRLLLPVVGGVDTPWRPRCACLDATCQILESGSHFTYPGSASAI